jgi:hypothetical protein
VVGCMYHDHWKLAISRAPPLDANLKPKTTISQPPVRADFTRESRTSLSMAGTTGRLDNSVSISTLCLPRPHTPRSHSVFERGGKTHPPCHHGTSPNPGNADSRAPGAAHPDSRLGGGRPVRHAQPIFNFPAFGTCRRQGGADKLQQCNLSRSSARVCNLSR